MNKYDHVRAKRNENKNNGHHCHWPDCDKRVPPAMWGCTYHWYKLPQYLRNKIWGAYEPGQEDTKTPSPRYIEIAKETQDWIKENAK
jgi:hypothetical protein